MCRAGGEQQPRSANFVTKFHVSCGPEWSRNEEQCNCNPGVLRERFPGVLREIVGAAGSSAGVCVAGQEHACRERLELRAVRVFVYAVMWSAVASPRTLCSRLAVAVGSEPESALSTVVTDYYLVLWIIDFIIIRLFRFVDMQFS
jgi:hypothetical protein